MDYWSDGMGPETSMHQTISMASVSIYRKSVLGFCFSNIPLLQHSKSMSSSAESYSALFQGATKARYFGPGIFTPGLQM